MLKRLFDFCAALAGLTLAMPLLLVIAALIRLNLGSPVFFRQARPGLGGQPFVMVKFRTMRDVKDASGHLLPDEHRITYLGRFLRATSLDELPELFNILKGEMSLVGPRPLLMEYLPLYSSRQARRHDVRPGLTGWAQINGRNTLSWEEKFELDVWYVENRSLLLDLRIIWLTVWKVIRREGISYEGHVTMERFRGTSESRAGSE